MAYKKSRATVHRIVTERIMEKLKRGEVPWRKPWSSYPAVNWITQKPYRGLNQLLLDPGEYATWNQIKKAEGSVKKGAKAYLVTFYKLLEVDGEMEMENVQTGETELVEQKKTIPYLRYYKVFDIKDCIGLESRRKEKPREHDPIKQAEKIMKGYRDAPPITHAPNRAYYRPSADIISIPEKSNFGKIEEYYSTLFHEMIHSTGHKSRLNRPGIATLAAFGSHDYGKEELVAEIGAAMLCGEAGIEDATIDNSAAYIAGWLKALQNDEKMIVQAASLAQKATGHILGRKDEC